MTTQDERISAEGGQEAPTLPLKGARSGLRPPFGHARAARVDDRLADEREASERNMTEDRELTDDDRLDLFRESLNQSILPDLPHFPGYHVCWLTTTNRNDSIAMRLRLGYELIRTSECPGWDGEGLKIGRFEGVVGIEEMVAARIPLRLYQRYIDEQHHVQPMEQEGKILSAIEGMTEQADRIGARLVEGDGLETLRTKARRPPPMTE